MRCPLGNTWSLCCKTRRPWTSLSSTIINSLHLFFSFNICYYFLVYEIFKKGVIPLTFLYLLPVLFYCSYSKAITHPLYPTKPFVIIKHFSFMHIIGMREYIENIKCVYTFRRQRSYIIDYFC